MQNPLASPHTWGFFAYILSLVASLLISLALLNTDGGHSSRGLFFARINVTHTLSILSPYILPNGTVTTTPDSHYDTPPIEAWRSVFALDELPDAYQIGGNGGFCRIYTKRRNHTWDACWSNPPYVETPMSIRAVVSHDLAWYDTSAISRESWARLFASAGVASRVDLARASVALLATSLPFTVIISLASFFAVGLSRKLLSVVLRSYLFSGLLHLASAIMYWYQFTHWADRSGLKNPAEEGPALRLSWALAGITLGTGVLSFIFSSVLWPPPFGCRKSKHCDYEMTGGGRPDYSWLSVDGGGDYGGDGGGDGGD